MQTAKVTIAGVSMSAVLIAALVALLGVAGTIVGYHSWRSALPNSTDSREVSGGGSGTAAEPTARASKPDVAAARAERRGRTVSPAGERGAGSPRKALLTRDGSRGPSVPAGRPARDAVQGRPGGPRSSASGRTPAAEAPSSPGATGDSGGQGTKPGAVPATPSLPTPAPMAPRVVSSVTTAVGNTVTQVTDTVGQVVTPISKPAGDLVGTTGKTVGGIVGGLGGGGK